MRDLYKGGYWSAVLRAVDKSRVPVRPLVVSAGLGVVDFGDHVPSYGATFSVKAEDRVPGGTTVEGRRAWWASLGGPARLLSALEDAGPARLLVALPTRYLEVASPVIWHAQDLLGSDQVVVLGAKASETDQERFGSSWVELDARMTRTLGGTAGQITASAAGYFLRNIDRPEQCRPERARQLLLPLVKEGAASIYPKRQRCTPAEVEAWIHRSLRSTDPPTSATNALRRFRDSGLAFEQRHFGRLYRKVVDSLGST